VGGSSSTKGVTCTGNDSHSPPEVGTYTYTLQVLKDSVVKDSQVRTVTVSNTIPPPQIDSFTATPTSITLGQTVSLSWSVSNSTGFTCVLDVTAPSSGPVPLSIDGCNSSTTHTPSVTGAHTYRLQVLEGSTPKDAKSQVVSVTPTGPNLENGKTGYNTNCNVDGCYAIGKSCNTCHLEDKKDLYFMGKNKADIYGLITGGNENMTKAAIHLNNKEDVASYVSMCLGGSEPIPQGLNCP
jgi:hypothetical protein